MASLRGSGDNHSMVGLSGSRNLQLIAAVLTWAIVSGMAFWMAAGGDERSAGALPFAVPLGLMNLAAMLLARDDRRTRPLRLGALWLQLASALAVGALLPVSFLPIYTIIWIAMATAFFSVTACLWLLGAILVAWHLIMTFIWQASDVTVTVLLYGTFHLFAMFTARNAHEAQEARSEAETLNRELQATQLLLSEASRQQERTRIARDLHDLLGHHLTALSLNLQIAERLADGEARTRIGESRALARVLLADVREAVDSLRDDDELDFESALRLLVDNTPGLDAELLVDSEVKIEGVDVAETLLRCVQEAITNTLKHADARSIRIRLWQTGQRVCLEIADDGAVDGELVEGHGLTGMRERLEGLRGSLKLATAGDGLRLQVEIPLPG